MKRFLMLALAATALSFPAAVTAAKPVDQVKGPACGDIDLSIDYTFDPGSTTSATASSTITTTAPSCKKVSYTVYYYDQAGTTQLASCSYPGDGVETEFAPCTFTSPTADPLCVYATSDMNGKIIDTAPNEGCAAFGEPIEPGGSGATSFH
jgi:uncharacterized protein YcfL